MAGVVQELLERKKLHFLVKGSDFVIKCTNPEHDDSNPSMRINNVTGIYQCFSCGWKGNILQDYDEKTGGIQMKRDKLLATLEQAKAEAVGLQFPSKAVLWDEEYRGISADTFKKYQAFTYQEEFPDRLMFPIRDFSGKIKVFHGRTLKIGTKPKYLNYPRQVQLPMFPHRPEIRHGRIILVEGIFDFLNLYDKGLHNVVAIFGTQKFDTNKLSLLKMLGVTGVDIFLDDDRNHPAANNPGQEAAAKLREMIDDYGMATVNIAYPNKDPGDLTQKQVTNLKDQLYE